MSLWQDSDPPDSPAVPIELAAVLHQPGVASSVPRLNSSSNVSDSPNDAASDMLPRSDCSETSEQTDCSVVTDSIHSSARVRRRPKYLEDYIS